MQQQHATCTWAQLQIPYSLRTYAYSLSAPQGCQSARTLYYLFILHYVILYYITLNYFTLPWYIATCTVFMYYNFMKVSC